MRYYDGRFLIYDSVTKFKASEVTEESLELLGGPSAVSLQVQEGTDLLLPYMKQKGLADPNNFSIPRWFKDMIDNASKVEMAKKGISARLTKSGVDFTEEDVLAIVNVPLEAHARRSTHITSGLLQYASGDLVATQALRRRIMVDDVPYKTANETLNQTSSTDKLGVRLPDAAVVTAHVLGDAYAKTPFEESYSPYPNRMYRMKQIVNILTAKSKEAKIQNINSAIDILTNSYKVKIPELELRKLRNAFQELPLDHVLGNPDNDTLEIQENEQDYYDRLVAFIKFHIHRFNSEVMSNASEEEIKQKSEQDFNTGVLPVRLTEYLDRLVFDASEHNFYHTGNFNYVVGDLDDTEEGVASESGGEKDSQEVFVAKHDPRSSDLDVAAASYLSYSARTFGAEVWAEGIIKLMRWGERKIRNLNVGLNNTQYLDLQTMNTVTQQIAELSQFEVDTDEHGRSLDIMAVTFCEFKPYGVKRAKSYPFILVGLEYGYLPGREDALDITAITNLFDVVKSYKAGKEMIYDLSYTEGRFHNDVLREELTDIGLEDLVKGKRKVNILEELMDYAVDNGVLKMAGSASAILRQEEFTEYMSTEPLLGRLADTPKPLRAATVQGGLLAVFQEGADDCQLTDLAELLNWYQDNVYETHLAGYNKLLGFEATGDNALLNNKNLKTSNFFGQGEEEEEQEEIEEFMYPIYEGPELKFNKIIRKPNDETVIGAYAVTPDGFRVFAGTNEIKEFAVAGQTVHTGQILLSLLETTLSADTKNGYTSKTKVLSDQSVISIYSALHGN